MHLNWGRYFSSPRKIALTIINALIAIIGGTIVRLVRDFGPSKSVLTANSAGWDCMCPEKRFTMTPRVPVLRAPTLAIKTSDFDFLHGVCFLICFSFPHCVGVLVYRRLYIDYNKCFRKYYYHNDKDDEVHRPRNTSHVYHDFSFRHESQSGKRSPSHESIISACGDDAN